MFVWRYMNLEKVVGRGLDLAVNGSWHKSLIDSANYSLQSIKNRPTNDAYSPMQIAYTPLHSGSGTVAWENPWLNISTSFTAASGTWTTNEHNAGTKIAGYGEWSAGVYRELRVTSYKLRSADYKFRVNFMVQNLLNKQYCIVAHYPMPGRSWRLSLSCII